MFTDFSILIEQVVKLAETASDGILEIYQQSRQFSVQTKADHSPLTQADLLSHEIISKGLQQLTPDIPVLSEEGLETPFVEREHWEYYWLVDPLDGTLEFIRHSGEFSINIALMQGHQPILAVVYVPVMTECYYAVKGQGAFKRTADNQTVPLRVRPYQGGELTIVASYGIKLSRIEALLTKFPHYKIIHCGSAWKFGFIAEGKADIYPRLGDTCEWDTAAGQCILEQAGGMIVDLKGQTLVYNSGEKLLNPFFVAVGDAATLMPALTDILPKLK